MEKSKWLFGLSRVKVQETLQAGRTHAIQGLIHWTKPLHTNKNKVNLTIKNTKGNKRHLKSLRGLYLYRQWL